MEHNEITRKLLSMDKNLFRNLHKDFSFNFEGNICFFRIDGKFTLNTVKKIAVSGGMLESAKCLLFTAPTRDVEKKGLWAFSPVLVDLRDNSFETVSVYGCKTFWRKSDFNDMRKCDFVVTFGIAQNTAWLRNRQKDRDAANRRKSNEQARSEYDAYMRSRFYAVKVSRDEDEGWIQNVEARDEKGVEVNLYHDWNWGDREHIADINKIIDGSGYYKKANRESLANRLKAYKKMKANKAYAQTDNSDKVTMVNALVSARKTILDAQFKNVKTSEEVSEFINKLYAFERVTEEVERFCKRTEEKTFASIEDSEESYKYILKQLTA